MEILRKIIVKVKTFFRSKGETQRLKELHSTASVFGTLDKLQSCGLLRWQPATHQLFMAYDIAVIQLRSREVWDAFMQNILLWATYKMQQEAWQAAVVTAESKAVVAYIEQHPGKTLTQVELAQIRSDAREHLSQSVVPMPKAEPFEVVIVHIASDTPEVMVVARYDPDTERTDFALWSEVSAKLKD